METFIILTIILFVVFVINRGKQDRHQNHRYHRGSFSKYDFADWDTYAEKHGPREPSKLSIVSDTIYRPKSVMGREEAHVFYKIENWVNARGRGERVFAQVPMGIFLKTTNAEAHKIIRYKRPDYLIVDRKGKPVCVAEYIGGGHFQGDASERAEIEERDEIKRIALANADIPLVEIFENEKDDDGLVWSKLDSAVNDCETLEPIVT